eukprot:scaffold634682_cov24-Prasinocladus_malaysianus.AAC.1
MGRWADTRYVRVPRTGMFHHALSEHIETRIRSKPFVKISCKSTSTGYICEYSGIGMRLPYEFELTVREVVPRGPTTVGSPLSYGVMREVERG